jgi:GH35 family endo-1,4-beta-xylanase
MNEANRASSYEPANGESLWVKRLGPAKAVESALGWAREAGKGAQETFIYNDYDVGETNLELLTQMRKDGELPDVIGLQSHMHSGTWPLEKVWRVCQDFSQFKRPIHFTETTVISGPKRSFNAASPPSDWKTTPEDEAAQADYVEKFYSLLFSHPSVKAITWWDLSDNGAWLNAPGGLLHSDMSPKPAYDRLMELTHRKWRTNAEMKTNAIGECQLRAFYGDYRVVVTDADGRSVEKAVSFSDGLGEMKIEIELKTPESFGFFSRNEVFPWQMRFIVANY